MPNFEKDKALGGIFEGFPVDDLDSVEVEGGLTWRQVGIVGVTSGFLALPEATDSTPIEPTRFAIKEEVYRRVREYFTDAPPSTARALLQVALGFAEQEYSRLIETRPEWIYEHEMVQLLVKIWGADVPFIDETLARNVMWYIQYDQPLEA